MERGAEATLARPRTLNPRHVPNVISGSTAEHLSRSRSAQGRLEHLRKK